MDAVYAEVPSKATEIKLTQGVLGILTETGKWAKFLAIIGYIGVGFMLLVAVVMFGLGSTIGDNLIGTLSNGLAGVIYLGMAALYFFPVHYLYRFSSHLKNALATGDEASMELGFTYLKKHYKFVGIMTIVVLSLYLLLFLFGIMAGVAVALFQ